VLNILIGLIAFFGLAALTVKATNYFADRWTPADKIDVEKILRRYNLWEQFKSGKLHCVSCNRLATFDTLGLLIEDSGGLIIVCKDPACVVEYFRGEEAHLIGN